jgi:hypothetical protein
MSDFGDEFVDIDGARPLERDVVELVLVEGDVSVGIDLVALDDVTSLETSSPALLECGRDGDGLCGKDCR